MLKDVFSAAREGFKSGADAAKAEAKRRREMAQKVEYQLCHEGNVFSAKRTAEGKNWAKKFKEDISADDIIGCEIVSCSSDEIEDEAYKIADEFFDTKTTIAEVEAKAETKVKPAPAKAEQEQAGPKVDLMVFTVMTEAGRLSNSSVLVSEEKKLWESTIAEYAKKDDLFSITYESGSEPIDKVEKVMKGHGLATQVEHGKLYCFNKNLEPEKTPEPVLKAKAPAKEKPADPPKAAVVTKVEAPTKDAKPKAQVEKQAEKPADPPKAAVVTKVEAPAKDAKPKAQVEKQAEKPADPPKPPSTKIAVARQILYKTFTMAQLESGASVDTKTTSEAHYATVFSEEITAEGFAEIWIIEYPQDIEEAIIKIIQRFQKLEVEVVGGVIIGTKVTIVEPKVPAESIVGPSADPVIPPMPVPPVSYTPPEYKPSGYALPEYNPAGYNPDGVARVGDYLMDMDNNIVGYVAAGDFRETNNLVRNGFQSTIRAISDTSRNEVAAINNNTEAVKDNTEAVKNQGAITVYRLLIAILVGLIVGVGLFFFDYTHTLAISEESAVAFFAACYHNPWLSGIYGAIALLLVAFAPKLLSRPATSQQNKNVVTDERPTRR